MIFIKSPTFEGHWQIGGSDDALYICLAKKPRWLTRFMCGLLLEWVWVDQK